MHLANGFLTDLVDTIPGIVWAFFAVVVTTVAGVAAVAINRYVRRRMAPVKVRKR